MNDMSDMMKKLPLMDALMRRGVLKEHVSGKPYFTGYDYQSLYDWDQYFESLVQLYMGWGSRYLLSGVDIFLDHQKPSGFIPRAIDPPELDRPDEASEMVKPFLSQILWLTVREDGKIDYLKSGDRFDRLTAYLRYWLYDMDKRGEGLSCWQSSPHTGMDNQRERAGDWGSWQCEGVELNSFLCRELEAYGLLCRRLGRLGELEWSMEALGARREAIQKQCWDEQTGFYYDVNAHTGARMDIRSVAGFAPLWAGVADAEQARRAVYDHLLNPEEFWRPWPIPAYSAGWSGYADEYLPGDIGCAWRRNTWIPTNYYTFQGLRRYGYTGLAKILADKTYELVDRAGLREYYATESGEGRGLDPFWGWSLLAVFMPFEARTGYDPTALDPSPEGMARVSFAFDRDEWSD